MTKDEENLKEFADVDSEMLNTGDEVSFSIPQTTESSTQTEFTATTETATEPTATTEPTFSLKSEKELNVQENLIQEVK